MLVLYLNRIMQRCLIMGQGFLWKPGILLHVAWEDARGDGEQARARGTTHSRSVGESLQFKGCFKFTQYYTVQSQYYSDTIHTVLYCAATLNESALIFASAQAKAAAKAASEKATAENGNNGAPNQDGSAWMSRKAILERKGSQSAQAKLGNDLAAALGRLRGIIRPVEDGGEGGSPHRSW